MWFILLLGALAYGIGYFMTSVTAMIALPNEQSFVASMRGAYAISRIIFLIGGIGVVYAWILALQQWHLETRGEWRRAKSLLTKSFSAFSPVTPQHLVIASCLFVLFASGVWTMLFGVTSLILSVSAVAAAPVLLMAIGEMRRSPTSRV